MYRYGNYTTLSCFDSVIAIVALKIKIGSRNEVGFRFSTLAEREGFARWAWARETLALLIPPASQAVG